MSIENKDSQLCLNCESPLAGPYCAICGQKHIEGSLTIRFFFGEIFEAITNTDSRVFRTFKDLFVRPGFVAKKYVFGGRKFYVNPVRLILLSVGCYLAILALNGWVSPTVGSSVPQADLTGNTSTSFSAEFYKAWYNLYSNHRMLIYLGAMPFAALAIRLSFYKSNYNYVSTLIMLLYSGALYSLYAILLVISYLIFGLEFSSEVRKIAEAIIGMFVYYQTVKVFYNFGWFKSIFATLWVFILLMIGAYLVTFILSGIIASWK